MAVGTATWHTKAALFFPNFEAGNLNFEFAFNLGCGTADIQAITGGWDELADARF
jgi:hypothetical protein